MPTSESMKLVQTMRQQATAIGAAPNHPIWKKAAAIEQLERNPKSPPRMRLSAIQNGVRALQELEAFSPREGHNTNRTNRSYFREMRR